MANGVTLPDRGSAREFALLKTQERVNRIRFLETTLLAKAVLAAGTSENDSFDKQLNDVNQHLSMYNDEMNPGRKLERASAEKLAVDKFSGFKGVKNLGEMFKGKKIKKEDKIKGNFKANYGKNWGKV